jgi:hypothetical protein
VFENNHSKPVVKSAVETINDDILTTQKFPRAHTEERKGFESGLITVIANTILAFEGGRRQQTCGPWKLL